ncbi:MAG: DUF1338 domain-containing protein [Proteobacteria bacterium]|jgi:hypothetical protein|nr:DUF1338 domain-containing protein [Pseudomonadota bacterium]
MKTLENLLGKMWLDYCQMNPKAKKIYDLLSGQGETVLNDHIALRTFDHPRLGIESLAKVFKVHGYNEKQDYTFVEKKLYAKHYEHSTRPELPKIFISELQLKKVSPFIQVEVEKMVSQIPESLIQTEEFSMCGRPWKMTFKAYSELAKESEYASWVAAYGFRPNHFTVNINALKKFSDITVLNEFLEKNGYTLNKSGGVVKGSRADYLEQSSTMAEDVAVKFEDGTHNIPGCYYEFAKRYPLADGKLYQGFVAKSADKIFESTNRQ